MALQAHSPSRLLLHSQSRLQSPLSTITQTPSTLTVSLTAAFNPKPLTLSFSRRRERSNTVSPVVEESQESSEPEAEAEAEEKEVTVAEELKKAMQERREKEGEEEFWGGVGREIREIEWPPFGKVLGTTSVVISVIFGSSVVLLTLNALLAELSDRVFAGKGVQDFFT
ncbi:hypothetical protein HN51_054822 [Arachis hypogaea]|nr:preprotein translocase subunit SECE1 [Arachis ipaensis]XP_016174036.1 preprotein translocase subunit SECE1 [Arachis ipaensis]XP_020967124.1 preprotein translocase subunit SECE1 [Arachis ipaensis]XP_025679503.1 preprotein translocase subunit SECE1 [Arachis hypogaea]XP_025679505.1 preprotein translocase subunit SECE1 [Arachis hypogaea]XP_025679506.1 preprotein translocase subunit SECE1 [Arachis hypogaea]RYQ90454.1 hypothetical protein Ahy_B09g096553 [Arachis hypogaea]